MIYLTYTIFIPSGKAAMITNILSCRYHFNHPSFSDVSREAKQFVQLLLHPDYTTRMYAKDALEHPWLKEKIGMYTYKCIYLCIYKYECFVMLAYIFIYIYIFIYLYIFICLHVYLCMKASLKISWRCYVAWAPALEPSLRCSQLRAATSSSRPACLPSPSTCSLHWLRRCAQCSNHSMQITRVCMFICTYVVYFDFCMCLSIWCNLVSIF